VLLIELQQHWEYESALILGEQQQQQHLPVSNVVDCGDNDCDVKQNNNLLLTMMMITMILLLLLLPLNKMALVKKTIITLSLMQFRMRKILFMKKVMMTIMMMPLLFLPTKYIIADEPVRAPPVNYHLLPVVLDREAEEDVEQVRRVQ
jgi:hypothetical protein